ncbi:MAG: aspartate aminotransferase family protein [bacterium]
MKLKEAQALEKKHFFANYARVPLLVERGRGNYLYDENGRKYLDLVTGLAVNSIGHAHPKVVKAVREQCGRLAHVSNFYYTEPMIRLAGRLTRLSGMEKVFFANSGAEANEAAIKLARKHSREKYGAGRHEIICFERSFHGRTIATLSATGTRTYRKGFSPLAAGFRHAAFNDLASVEKNLTKKTCAIMVEPVQGEGGVYAAESEFMKGLDALRLERGVLLVFDEVQCGLGRTGRWFAFEHYGVAPDVLTLAKSLGGGLPLGAMLARGGAGGAFTPGAHASTFGANPVACAAANAFLDVLKEERLVERARRTGAGVMKKLETLGARTPGIAEVRGLGLMIAVELKKRSAKDAAAFFLENGVLVNAIRENIIRILPPFTVEEGELDRFLSLLEDFLKGAKGRGGGGK